MKKGIVYLLMVTLLAAGMVHISANWENKRYQKEIAQKVLRFHILAKSDEEQGENLKLEVRDEIGSYLREKLKEADDLEESKQIVEDNLDRIETIAYNTMKKSGYDYGVDAYLAKVEFPDKTYGEYTFPAGRYDALEVVLGKGEGHNWWCVMYPNMCFSGKGYDIVGEEQQEVLEHELTVEEYASLMKTHNYKIKFKYLTFFNE